MLLFALLSLIAGCGGTSGQAGDAGGIAAKVQWPGAKGLAQSLPAEVVTVRMAVSGPGMVTVQREFAAASGSGTIDNVPAGSGMTVTLYGVDASGVVLYQGSTGNVTVAAGITTDVGTIVMERIGGTALYTISGSIVTPSGAPVAGATVSLSGAASMTTQTDAAGNFIFAVPAGSYKVSASAASYQVSPPISVTVSAAPVTANFTATAPEPATQNRFVRGRVTQDGAALSGVAVTLTGSRSLTTQTDGNGQFSFEVPDGSYTLTASKVGYTMSQGQSVTVQGADVAGIAFVATPERHAIVGKVSVNGAGLAGVTVTLGGPVSQSTQSDAQGGFTFLVPNGSYTLSAAKSGYTISSHPDVSVNGADVSGVEFSATRSTYSISGRVTFNGSGLAGVTFDTIGGSATTNASGYYTLSGLPDAVYTLSPQLAGYAFTPHGIYITVSGADVANVDFTATNAGTIMASLQWQVVAAKSLPLAAAPAGVARIRATVYTQQEQVLLQKDVVPAADGTVRIDGVPAGTGYFMNLQAFDGQGLVTYQGFASRITVRPGATVNVGTVTMTWY